MKKPEYGPATIHARGVTWAQPSPAPYLCQAGCSVTVDDRVVPGVALDVEDLYRRKILGK